MSYTPMKIVITGTCLAYKIGEILKYFIENVEIVQIPVHQVAGKAGGPEFLKAELATADYWIYLDQAPLYHFAGEAIRVDRTVRYPIVTFSAFHPDLIYANDQNGARLIGPAQDCHSAIVLWAYLRSLSASDTVKLFCTEKFQQLGYFNYWTDSAKAMEADFLNCDLDFRRFYTRVKRYSPFMHTINHPIPAAIVELVRLILPKIGYCDVVDRPVERYIEDNLLELVWPIYPGIGEQLGLVPMMNWRIKSEILDLETFVEQSFEAYGLAGLTSVCSPRLNGPLYDSVLGGVK